MPLWHKHRFQVIRHSCGRLCSNESLMLSRYYYHLAVTLFYLLTWTGSKVNISSHLLCIIQQQQPWTNMDKLVIQILQGNAVSRTILDGLNIYSLISNFLWCTSAKNYDNWLTAENIITITKTVTIFWAQCIMLHTLVVRHLFVVRIQYLKRDNLKRTNEQWTFYIIITSNSSNSQKLCWAAFHCSNQTCNSSPQVMESNMPLLQVYLLPDFISAHVIHCTV